MAHQTANPTLPEYATTPADRRRMPWNVMGKALEVKAQHDFPAALHESGLDFQTRMVPITGYEKAEDEPLAFADFHQTDEFMGVVRPWGEGQKLIGVTGKRFVPFQNRDAFGVGEVLVNEHGARIAGMADFRNGKVSMMVIDFCKPIELDLPGGGTDVLDLNLLVTNAHDGQAARTLALIAMRIACTNAVNAAMAGAQRVWKASHTPNGHARMAEADDAMLKAIKYHDALASKAQAMVDTPMNDQAFAKTLAKLFPVPKEEGIRQTRTIAKHQEIIALHKASPTLEGVRGTVWGGYNAITEWLDHYRPVRGDQEVSRAEGQIEGPNVRTKDAIWKTFSAV